MLQRISMKEIEQKLDYIFLCQYINWREKGNEFQKRKIIYDYMVNNLRYDFDSLNNILNKGPRNPYQDIYDVLYNNKGVCHGFSYVYKILLSRVGIYSILVICKKSIENVKDIRVSNIKKIKQINHMLNLTKEGNTFSFDDLTLGCLALKNDNDKSKFFDYDIEHACQYGQKMIGGMTSEILDVIIKDRYREREEKTYEKNKYDNGLFYLPIHMI